MNNIENVVSILKLLDERQLLELFHEIEDLECIERIADCAYQFIEETMTNLPKPIIKSGTIITYSTDNHRIDAMSYSKFKEWEDEERKKKEKMS